MYSILTLINLGKFIAETTANKRRRESEAAVNIRIIHDALTKKVFVNCEMKINTEGYLTPEEKGSDRVLRSHSK